VQTTTQKYPKKIGACLARERVSKLITKSPFPNGLWVEKRKSLKRREEKRMCFYEFITESIFEFKRFLSACKNKEYKIIINSKRKCCVIMCIVVVQFVY
jgi:hypothetical protein